MDFSIILGTYGDRWWEERAEKLAVTTSNTQDYDDEFEVIQYHGDTLASARNHAAEDASGEYLVFLDTGDYLDPGYLAGMAQVEGDIRRPSTRGFNEDGFIEKTPVLGPRPSTLLARNFIVIAAAVDRGMFLNVGGFSELPVLEDWDLWLKLVCLMGANVTDAPDAVYLIEDSHERNKHPDIDLVAHRIRQKYSAYRSAV